jgi:hypothetical protein
MSLKILHLCIFDQELRIFNFVFIFRFYLTQFVNNF